MGHVPSLDQLHRGDDGEKIRIPWIKVNFIGAEATAKTLRKIAKFFESKKLTDRVEEVIAQEMIALRRCATKSRPGTRARKRAVCRRLAAHHYQDLFRDLGMEIVSAGYEFAHRDDYEGRKVLPTIKVDADSRNIEELHVEADPVRFRARKPGTNGGAAGGRFLVQGLRGHDGGDEETNACDRRHHHHEMEKLIEIYKPDIIGSGIKDKFVIEKMGVPCKQLHSYDYSGPYAAFGGAINFYREVDRMLTTKVWKYITPPWRKRPWSPSPSATPARTARRKTKKPSPGAKRPQRR